MAQFINYNSFLILVVMIFIVAAVVLLRRGRQPRHLAGLAGVAVLVFLIYSGMRPAEPISEQPAEIQARIGAGTPVLLEFMSPNWLACVAAEPIVNGLKTELVGSLEVVTVNMYTDAGRTLSAEYSAFGTPTFIFFDAEGEEQWRQIGSIDSERVRNSVYQNWESIDIKETG